MCEGVCQKLRDAGCSCDYYHAGLDMEKRKSVHHQFIRDELQVWARGNIGCVALFPLILGHHMMFLCLVDFAAC